jgi:polysaccharide export outer membrane protein
LYLTGLTNVRLRPGITKYFAALSFLTVLGCGSQAVTTTITAHPRAPTKPYIIGIDDILKVIVWNQPQLSGTMPVADDGTIEIPLAGRVTAAGLTTQMLEKSLHDKLASFTNDPQVTVRVADPRSDVFYVVGEVHKPGVLRLMSGEVLSQALAEAGGLTAFANPRAIRIVRRRPTQNVEITVNFKRVQNGDLSADIPLEPGDTITVP